MDMLGGFCGQSLTCCHVFAFCSRSIHDSGGGTSTIHDGQPCAEKQYVDGLFLRFDLLAHFVYNAYQAHIRFDKYVLALGVERFALGEDTVSSILGATYEVCAWLARVFRELLEGCLTDPARGSNKDRDKIRGEGGRDERV